MAAPTTQNHFKHTMLLLGLLILTSLHPTAGQVGSFFGRLGTNLPGAATTVGIYQQNNIRRMRLFDPHAPTLRALSGTNIRLMMGVSHPDLRDLANCPQAATAWVSRNILRFPNVTFRYIIVGNEIEPESELGPFVFPAMQNVYRAIRAAGLGGRIQVSTSIQINLLTMWNPPQAAEFKCSVNWFIRPILEFIRDTSASIHLNVFPFYAYLNDRANINLSFALLQPNSGVVLGGVYYDNLFYAIHDAFVAAMGKILAAATPLSVGTDVKQAHTGTGTTSSTGHTTGAGRHSPTPSVPLGSGDEIMAVTDGPIATLDNARIYINNLMRVVRTGTPMVAGPIHTYIFATFDENLRPGPEYERHFGIFLPNGQPKFPFRFQ
ncbi:glucan endo-1,3-beta-glucosidase, acidic-like [Salvia miltiorrhiza]|uniref:glucan endo-1,3-beta-glucosidase, acidic-like n=1 Tax=Salvia miltiorrhiza TaxID=226208 RepID=UPI0025ACAC5E|nr:glucan endo-1,3-beta-glucosidase, acidic-like [Salvia miltiorrhiza]